MGIAVCHHRGNTTLQTASCCCCILQSRKMGCPFHLHGWRSDSPHPLLVAVEASQASSFDLITKFKDGGHSVGSRTSNWSTLIGETKSYHALTMRVMNKELIKLKGREIQADDHVDGQILTSAARILFHTALMRRENTAVACLDLFPNLFKKSETTEKET